MPTQRNVSILEKFPTDIWAEVASYICTKHILLLKMTGSKHLWAVITCKNVVKSAVFETIEFSCNRWPQFLNELPSIEELDVETYKSPWTPRLHMVSSRTRKLKFREFGENPASFFFDSFGSPISFAEYVPRLEVLDVYLDWTEDNLWMLDMPPSLKKLTCRFWNGTFPLPETLRHCEIRVIDLRGQTNLVPMPARLESLKANLIPDFAPLLPLLPNSLVSFEEHMSHQNATSKAESVDLFPKSLTNLVYQSKLGGNFQKFSAMTELNVWFANVEGWRSLPASLTKLEVSHDVGFYIDLEPQTLNDIPTSPYNLVNLTSLTLCNLISASTAKQLPPSLRYLNAMRLEPEACEFLPRGLVNLKASMAHVNDDFIHFLPDSLTTLSLGIPSHKSKWKVLENGTIQKYKHFLLNQLQKDPPFRRWEGQAKLPPQITFLDLDEHDLEDRFFHEDLQKVTTLSAPGAKNLTNNLIPCLSRCMVSLSLQKASKITSRSFVHLPRLLKTLVLSSALRVFDEEIAHLPRSLETLNLDKASELTPKCIKDLPTSLTELSLRYNKNIRPSSLRDLPPLLRSRYRPDTFTAYYWTVNYGTLMYEDGLRNR